MSQPGDPYEREAERVAEAVVNLPVTSHGSRVDSSLSAQAETLRPESPHSRAGATEASLGRSAEHLGLLRSVAGGQATTSGPGTSASGGNLKDDFANSSGEPLSLATRAHMESSFGANFGDVRIHADARSASAAPAISAKAFTIGSHIFFAKDAFQPDSDSGRRLLAHELTHVIQQRSGIDLIQRYDESTEPNTKFGQEAADVASGLIPPFGIGRAIYAAYCLNKLEQPMIDITFNRWIADACSRTTGGIMHSREWDAFGHCWIGCEGSRKCGVTPTHFAGTVREYYREGQRILKVRPHDSFKQDLANQALGRTLSYQAGTCYKLCDDAHGAGTMDLSAPVADCLDCSLTRVPCP